MSRYDDIINLPHHVSKTRKPMSMTDRAAQFAPFAALSGHNEALAETVRQTSPKEILSQDELDRLSARLTCVIEHMTERNELSFVYYVPDEVKDGGKYVELTGIPRRYDEYERVLVMSDGRMLPIDNILTITGKLFDDYDL